MIRKISIVIMLVAAVGLVSCTQQQPTSSPDLTAEAQAIRDASANWGSAYEAKDWAAAAAYFAPDGTFFLQNREPVTGPSAIQASTEKDWAAMPNAAISLTKPVPITSAMRKSRTPVSTSLCGKSSTANGKYLQI
jgi:hypothetical protein